MHDFVQFLPILGFFLLIGGFGLLAIRWERKQAATWTVIAEGEFDSVEHRQYTYTSRSGAMVHTTSYHRATMTVVHFIDGRSFSKDGRHEMPFPQGTRLRVHRNGLGTHRFERLA